MLCCTQKWLQQNLQFMEIEKKYLSYSPEEKPLALQVGGSDKAELAEVAKIAEDMGYDEININLGCPSKKVQKNMFGACLMREPDLSCRVY